MQSAQPSSETQKPTGGTMAQFSRSLFTTTIAVIGIAAPSAAQAQTREEITRKPVSSLPDTSPQTITVNDGIERAPCPLSAPEFADLKLTLSGAEFRNLTGISTDLLQPAYQAYIGKTISLATVCDIRDSAATILRKAGYLAAVQVPPQKIDNGTVQFDVLVAKIVDFQVRGNAGKAERLISGYLSAIKDQPVFNIVEAERYLLLARDIPGYDVRLTLRPAGTAPGEVIGEVLVNYTPVEAEINVQNYGSKETGRFGGLAQVHYNGLFGAGDRTSVGYFATADFKEQHVVQLNEQFRVGREGLTLGGDFYYAWTAPSLGPGIDLKSRTWVGSLEARYPLIRRQTKNLVVAGGLDAVEQRVRVAGIPLTTDKLRVAFARLEYETLDLSSIGSVNGYSGFEPKWRLGGSLEVRQGIGILGNSKGCGPTLARCSLTGVVPISRLEADTTAFVARASVSAEYRPLPVIALVANVRAQYAPNPLLSFEEFSAGNFTIGRGYDPGVLTGDSGVGVAGEMRFGSLVPANAKSFAFQAYAYTDAAWVWNRDISAIANDPQRLVSAGGGLRMTYGDRANLDIGAAFPLKKAGLQTERADTRVLVNLTIKLLPWKRR
jgi:hemolysin activation/secretion protein